MKSYFTYVLLCADSTLYCGFTDDLEKRIARHNSGRGDAKYTKSRLPVTLIAFVKFDNEHDAKSCEWWFKHKAGPRAAKDRLIGTNSIEASYLKWSKNHGK